MKKLACFILTILCMQQASAANTANIKIQIAGVNDNTYFLCMPDLGCLSMLAAKRGKVFPLMNNVEMNTLFVTNIHNRRVYNQGLPSSCNVTVKKNQTITITGTLNKQTDKVSVSNLHCSVS